MGGTEADYFNRKETLRRFDGYFQAANRRSQETGSIYATDDGNGAAVWLSPEDAATFGENDAADRHLFKEFMYDDGARYDSVWDWIDAQIPARRIWYLDQLGVMPSARGKGHGSALVEFGLRFADEAREPAFLETATQRNADWYRTFGFEVVLRTEAPGGGPTVWFMVREARG